MKYGTPRLFRNKKGINDISILTGIIIVFFLSALMIPFINAEFGTTSSEFDTESVRGEVQQDADSVGSINAFTVLLTVLKLGGWDFGDSLSLPFWLDALYSVLAIVFTLTIARNIWVGGGG